MGSQGEKIGSALAKAIRGTAAKIKEDAPSPAILRTNIRHVPKAEGLTREDGWIDTQVQFLIDKKSTGADNMIARIVLKPGARHEAHRHHNCDAFFIVLEGKGHIVTGSGETPSVQGDVVYSPRASWHGFANTSDADVVLVWGLMGAGSIEASGYQRHPEKK